MKTQTIFQVGDSLYVREKRKLWRRILWAPWQAHKYARYVIEKIENTTIMIEEDKV